jgi:hypothetical protein
MKQGCVCVAEGQVWHKSPSSSVRSLTTRPFSGCNLQKVEGVEGWWEGAHTGCRWDRANVHAWHRLAHQSRSARPGAASCSFHKRSGRRRG